MTQDKRKSGGMKIAIIGSGGREHALGWKLAQEAQGHELFFLPGNGGTRDIGANVDVRPSDLDGVSAFAAKMRPDLVVVGPEEPLALGLADRLGAEGYLVFGPVQAAARLESSKVFAKELMSKYGVPTAPYRVFTSSAKAHAYVDRTSRRLVVKADGLAQGKGAVVAKDRAEAHRAVEAMMEERAFGGAGETVVIEERLAGEEASILAITDGRHYALLPVSQDHKRVFDRDRGPNTGGMGAYSPAPVADRAALARIEEVVLKRTLKALAKEGLTYRGVLYAGLMLNESGVHVIEFNVRFGDPETQAVLAAIDAPLGEMLLAAAAGDLKRTVSVKPARWAVCVVAASGGYPGQYDKGLAISGLDEAGNRGGVMVFHAGTKAGDGGKLVTSGGRVLGVTGVGQTLRQARRTAYVAIRQISFKGMHFRTDIGLRGLRRLHKMGVIAS
jgi:phosphoribosylamine---glycine ligase